MIENIELLEEHFLTLLKKNSEIPFFALLISESEKRKKLLIFLQLLYKKNQVMNLTAIREPEEILEKHFIDSLFLTNVIYETDKTIIDLGTGAGFPGLVLAICYPEKTFLLVDSVQKKIAFIQEVVETLLLTNVQTSTERAEVLIQNYREYFDVALCRGVAHLSIILEYMIPFVKIHGRFLPQKLTTDELIQAKKALHILHSKVKEIHTFYLPKSNDVRIILEIEKMRATDNKYPRKVGIPSKNPL